MITAAALEGSATNLIPAKSLVLITRVSVGKWAFLDEAVAINQDLTALTPTDDRLIPEFLKCVAPQLASQIDASAVGVGVRGVTREFLGDLEIPLPPLEEQRRIKVEIEGHQKILDGARQIVASYRPRIETNPDWPAVALGSIFKLSSGKGLTAKSRDEGKHPVYGGNGITGYHNTYFIEAETLVIGRVGAYCGAVHLTQPKSWITDNALYVTQWLQEVDQGFIAHAVRDANLNAYAKQGGQPYISQSIVAEIEIPLPPLEEQRRIVAELDAEAAQMDSVRGLIPRFEAKIQRVLDGVWGSA